MPSSPPPSIESSPAPSLLGLIVDERYAIEKVLGEGGMGTVYRCKHISLHKPVAMKVLRADLAQNEELTERFLNEARSASSMSHPHIVQVSDFGRLPDGRAYFIMEYLEGIPLSRVLDEARPLPVPRVLSIIQQIAQGLAAAHEVGVIHRDLKPDNIFLTQQGGQKDFVKILDFGIAKVSSAASRVTQTGQVFGTPHYMSPEQAAGHTVDPRADLYSLGIIFYEMLVGRLPFEGDHFMSILTQQMYKAPSRFQEKRTHAQDIPEELEPIVFLCLSKNPDERYASMRDFEADLERFLQGHPTFATRSSLRGASREMQWFPSGERRETRPWWFLPAALTAAVLAAGLAWWLTRPEPPAPYTPAELPAAPALPTSSSAQPPAPANEPEPPTAQPVVLAVSPLEAHIYQDEEDLGTSPVTLLIPPEGLTVQIRHPGYQTQTVHLQPDEPRQSLTLRPLPSAPSTPRPPSTSPTPASGASAPPSLLHHEIIQPWD